MKLLKYGLFLGVIGLLASCSNEDLNTPQVPNQNLDNLEDVYFSINVGQPGVRTTTPNHGNEGGQDALGENLVKKILLVFAKNDNTVLTSHEIDLGAGDNSKSITQIFKLEPTQIEALKKLDNSATVKLFVVCNPTSACTFTEDTDVQKTLQLASDVNTYWDAENGFLMSNADLNYTATIDFEGINAGKYGKGKEVHALGTIKVQRAAARIDICKDQPSSSIVDTKVKVNFDGVALVNLDKNFYLFKQVGTDANTWQYFAPETGNNWVIDPMQAKNNLSSGFDTYFINVANSKPVGEWVYTSISGLNQADNKDVSYGSGDTNAASKDYFVWRYATPNNILGVNNQKNGNSTGVIFRAEMQKQDDATIENTTWGTDDIFVYGGIVYGSYNNVKAVAANPQTDTDRGMANVFNSLKTGSTDPSADQLSANSRFKKFSPVGGKYYSYYYYWIRHNNNGNNEVMDNMEFQVVRNNIYKLAVTKVADFGVPGTDKPDPSTPDENPDNEVNFSVEVEVVNWDVRVDDIEF